MMLKKTAIPLFAGSLLFHACANKEQQPNILFIMADDHTTQAISCYEGIFAKEAATVNIDKIAEEGMLFTNAFCTNAICSPSRATILTGKYSNKNGVYILNQQFDSSQVTSNKIFRNAGYQTAVFGKWHLKSVPAGFDDYKVLKEQGRHQNPQFIEKGIDTMVTRQGWSTDIITGMTMDFIKKRDKNKPFFVMCQFKTTHDPWATRPPYDTLFANHKMPVPENLFDTYEKRSEASRRTTLKLEYMNQSTFPHKRLEDATDMEQREYIYQQYIRAFLQCGRPLDENVGKLMKFLEEHDLKKNTIVIYTADQGHFLGEHGFFSKRFMYDETMRMPLIIRYPGKIKPGTKNHDLVANIDFAPTIVDLAGLEIPEEMQGESIKPLLEGHTPGDWRDAIYYQYWQHLLHRDVTAHYGIRTKTHKLIYFHGQPLGQTDYPPVEPDWEFYDLMEDPTEMNNIYNEPIQKELIGEIKNKMVQLKEKYGCTDDQYPELEQVNQTHFW